MAAFCPRRARVENKHNRSALDRSMQFGTQLKLASGNFCVVHTINPSIHLCIHLSDHLSCPRLMAAAAGTPAKAPGNRKGNTLHRLPAPRGRPHGHKNQLYQFGKTNWTPNLPKKQTKTLSGLQLLGDRQTQIREYFSQGLGLGRMGGSSTWQSNQGYVLGHGEEWRYDESRIMLAGKMQIISKRVRCWAAKHPRSKGIHRKLTGKRKKNYQGNLVMM